MIKEFKHTPGPWRFELNESTKDINLCGGKSPYDLTVMGFDRYGMGGAQPTFRTAENFMDKACNMGVIAKGREHHKHWFKLIDNPDANLIEAAPDLFKAVLRAIDVIEDLLKDTKSNGLRAGTEGVLRDIELPYFNEVIEMATKSKAQPQLTTPQIINEKR